jgi:hypothetical protein
MFHLAQYIQAKAYGKSFLMYTRLCHFQQKLCGMFSGITHNAYANFTHLSGILLIIKKRSVPTGFRTQDPSINIPLYVTIAKQTHFVV